MAGKPFVDATFDEVGCRVEWLLDEGATVDTSKGKVKVAVVTGKARQLLIGERTALNVLARASGIATAARRLVDIKIEAGWHGVVAGTRKTTPGFRLVEKYAMLVGGADTHRMDLSSMVMLKDNHIMSHGSITEAVKQARRVCGFAMKIEVECSSLADGQEALLAGADIVMLDNLDPPELQAAARTLKAEHPSAIIEGSGGITRESIRGYMVPEVDVLSTSSIHQGCPHVDFSLSLSPP
jgi:nicotinate-nucleotide pyrophosphorylase (carboxylating)